jgi:hypothetical protein
MKRSSFRGWFRIGTATRLMKGSARRRTTRTGSKLRNYKKWTKLMSIVQYWKLKCNFKL